VKKCLNCVSKKEKSKLNECYLCQMNLTELLTQTIRIVQETGTFIQTSAFTFNSDTFVDKSLNQLVSEVDIQAENMLVRGLSKLQVDAGFIGEENTISLDNSKDYQWIIDPLDGTTNFLHGLPVYCISVALAFQGKPILGVILELNKNELFYATKGGGAFLNEKKIKVTDTQNLNKTLIATGFPYYNFEAMEAYLDVLNELMRNTRGLRRLGSAAVDLAYTACGRFDGFFEWGLSPWDVAAGIIIVQEAGGSVTDFENKQNYLFGKSIIAGNPTISLQLQQIIAKKFSL
jgi:myo-inositol-1(or 4)-monophosphatase